MKFEESSPTHIPHGSLASQVRLEFGSNPLLLPASGVLPVGSTQKYIVKVTLPSEPVLTGLEPPASVFCSVRPSQSLCACGLEMHSSNLIGKSGLSSLLAAMVTVRIPASPR